MKSMPVKIKNKLRQLQNTQAKARKLEQEVAEMFEEYDVNIEYLRAVHENDVIQTEALTHISYAEGYVEENIADIEEVFLYYVNNMQNS